MFKTIFILSAILLFSPTLTADDNQEIMDVDRAFSVMAKEQGSKAAFDHYLAREATALNPNQNAIVGRETITATMSSDPFETLLQWEPQDGMIAASGDLAYTWGTYVLIVNQTCSTQQTYGKYITIWIKEEGRWKAILDMGNASPPPQN